MKTFRWLVLHAPLYLKMWALWLIFWFVFFTSTWTYHWWGR